MSDSDLLNFALNLEYLEGEFYTRALTGGGLADGGGAVRGGRQVPFRDPRLHDLALSIMRDEQAHVRYLKGALGGAAVPEPAIDLAGGFRMVAHAAGLGARFDPFADEESFLLGAFLFEDVGVTAYHGAAPLLQSKDILTAAAGIHATEAYHAGMLRGVLFRRGERAIRAANAISALRGKLGDGADFPIAKPDGAPNFVGAGADGIAPGRTPQAVLGILYAAAQPGVAGGGFFPQGVNGAVRTT